MPVTACPSCCHIHTLPDHTQSSKIDCSRCGQPFWVPVHERNQRRAFGVLPDRPKAVGPVESIRAESAESLPAAQPKQMLTGSYYVRDHWGQVSGPFSSDELRRRARCNQLFPSWRISPDKVHWTVAAKVPQLFDVVESALARQLPPGKRLRDLTPAEKVGLLVDRFVLRDTDYLSNFPFLTPLRRLIARWTLPKTIVLAHVTASGTRYVRFDPAEGEERIIDQAQANRVRDEKVRTSSLFPLLVLCLAIPWAIWIVWDFSWSLAIVKTLLVNAVILASKVWDVRRTKVLIGYDMDAATCSRLLAVRNAFGALSHSSRVWLCRLEAHRTTYEWKLSGGMAVKVSKMPAVVFSRKIPNVDSNVRVMGLTYENKAVYFLPENIMVTEGNVSRYVDYSSLQIETSTLEVNDTERRRYADAQPIRYTYRVLNVDGTPDRRFSDNRQDVPIYRFGHLLLSLGCSSVEFLLTNRAAAAEFRQAFFSRPAVPESSPVSSASDDWCSGDAVDGNAANEERQDFREWVDEVIIPALGVMRAVPIVVWAGVFVLASVILIGGGIHYLARTEDTSLEKADSLYEAGKRGEAAALYRRYPQQLLRPDDNAPRYLRRLIEYSVESGDRAEARSWIEKSFKANVQLEFNDPEAAELYKQMKGERNRAIAQAKAEEEARRKAAAAEEERHQNEERERALEEQRRREESEALLRAKEKARLRAEREAQERSAREARELAERERAEREEKQRKETLARLEKKAQPYLRYAKKLISEGMTEKAKERLDEIIRDFSGTPSAEEAKSLRKTLD
jgi:hypothetical protein